MKNVLIVSNDKYPNEDAGAIRDHAFALIYQHLGYRVFHICGQMMEVSGVYEHVQYHGSMCKGYGLLKQITSQLYSAKRLKICIKDLGLYDNPPEIVHFVSQNLTAALWLKKFIKRYHCKVIYACVEWYSPCNYPGGILSFPYLLNYWLNHFYFNKDTLVIAISTYFQDYFTKKGNKTVYVPVIMDLTEYIPNFLPNKDKLVLSYVGSPAQKDMLISFIRGLMLLSDDELKHIQFNFVGVDEEYIKKKCQEGLIDYMKISDNVCAFGLLPREEALRLVRNSDFSLLMRPENEIYAKAGFPTKFVEACMNGTPMMCNFTSDLRLYLENGINGIQIEDTSDRAIVKAYREALHLSEKEKREMRMAAYQLAQRYFDYEKYKKVINDVIS